MLIKEEIVVVEKTPDVWTWRVSHDEWAETPRDFAEGVMFCWHSRYNLSDDDAKDYLTSYALRDWRNLVDNMPSDTPRDELWDAVERHCARRVAFESGLSWRDLVVLPVYMYDHGGIALSTGGFSCPWDSGRVGLIVSKPSLVHRTNANYPHICKVLGQEVESYSHHVNGNTYIIEVLRNGEVVADQHFLGYEYEAEDDARKLFAWALREHGVEVAA